MGVAVASGAAGQAAPVATAPGEAGPGQAPAGPEEATPAPAAELALGRFTKGHSCSQAVFTVFAERAGLAHDTAMKIASGFGGGMWSGGVCGAVTGAYMALGLEHGGDPNAPIARRVRELSERFKAKHRSIVCAELLGVDLSQVDLGNPEAVQALKERLMKDKNPMLSCGAFVRDAAELGEAMIREKA